MLSERFGRCALRTSSVVRRKRKETNGRTKFDNVDFLISRRKEKQQLDAIKRDGKVELGR